MVREEGTASEEWMEETPTATVSVKKAPAEAGGAAEGAPLADGAGAAVEGTAAKPAAGEGKKKKVSAAQKRERKLAQHKWVRLAVQVLFFVLAPGMFSSAFNGVKYLCTQLGAMGAIEITSFVVVLAGTLLFTVVFGRFFCGYACAFGAAGDVLYLLFTPLRKALKIPSINELPVLNAVLCQLRWVVLGAICVMCFTGVWSQVNDASPWTVFASLTGGSLEGLSALGLGLLVAIAVLQALFERSFCRYLCPMGAVFSLMPMLPFSQFKRFKPSCANNCDRCQKSCPMGIHPDSDSLRSGECISCGRCAVVCPLGNVTTVYVEEPPVEVSKEEEVAAAAAAVRSHQASAKKRTRVKRPAALLKVEGSAVGWVVLKAVLLVAVCWLVGLLRFAPGPADVLPFALPWL